MYLLVRGAKMKAIQTDVVIIGAGPVGLFQVFELGLQGFKAVVVDSLKQVGGQCGELYPDKPIYDIPAIPVANAADIVKSLQQQASPFEPTYLLGHRIEKITKRAEHDFLLTTDQQVKIACSAVVIAAGNGSFEPVKLKVAGIEQFINKQLHYHVSNINSFKDKTLVVLGGGDAALDWALTLQQVAASVVLIHRSLNFRASQSSVNQMHQLCDELKMQFLCGQVTDFKQQNGKLTSLIVSTKGGLKRTVELEKLLVCFGQSPKNGPTASWGLDMYQHLICVDTEKFQTSTRGIYAVGDCNYYPGKRKLILSGFHESALAAFSIAQDLNPAKRIATLYTTTSPIVHKRMGLESTVPLSYA